MVAAFPASCFGPLYYRNVEIDKIRALAVSKGDFDAEMSLTEEGKEHLHWWVHNIHTMYAPIHLPPIAKVFSTDASAKGGWGAVMADMRTRGAWLPSEIDIHINVK